MIVKITWMPMDIGWMWCLIESKGNLDLNNISSGDSNILNDFKIEI